MNESLLQRNADGGRRTFQRKPTTFLDAMMGDNTAAPMPAARPSSSSSSPTANSKRTPRLLDRDSCDRYGQRRRMNITRLNRPTALFLADWFHFIVADLSTQKILTLFCMVYILCFLAFAVIYWLASDRCNLNCDKYVHAVFLSIETMMTIGYGVPDPYFKQCHWFVIVLVWQMFVAIFLDAALVGLVYQRISRGTQRSHTILFSDKAVLRTVGHSNYFMFQVCEMRRSELLECHVRLFLFFRNRDADPPVQMHPMRLEQPDDNLGAMMILALPALVVHRVDSWSPLRGVGAREGNAQADNYKGSFKRFESLVAAQRMSDCDSGANDSVWCEVCGESYARLELLHLHVKHCARAGTNDTAHEQLLERLPKQLTAAEIRENIQASLDSGGIEIVCILEGVDPTTSSSVQARHSYTAEDIVWDHDFADCVCGAELPDGRRNVCIDFDRFHELVKPDHNSSCLHDPWRWSQPK